MKLDDLLRLVDYLDGGGEPFVRQAYELAELAHGEQRRQTGEPYIEHPLRVAQTVAELKLDVGSVAAALLHDVPEDTPFTLKDIDNGFGREISMLVDGVTKLGHLRATALTEEEQFETFQRFFLAMAKDIRVVMIKLADRLDNMRTIRGIPAEKQKAYAKETLDIFAPLAARLGIATIKGELEDLAFPFVYPAEYDRTVKTFGEHLRQRSQTVESIQRKLLKELAKEHIRVVATDGRVKHLYSAWRKLEKYNWDVSRIHDLVALRIIVSSLQDCYATLGIVHKLWRPLPGRFDDYIATPKSSGYQSLHTDVFTDEGVVEIQTRTAEMHEHAEHGIAAHWVYSERKRSVAKIPKWKTAWIHELAKSIRSGTDYKSLKIDFFTNQIFVFTPKGDIIDLPEGATPIKRNWLEFVKTGHARTAIRHHFHTKNRSATA
jgi:guanosine-3',5'-bis(diphosphate) 3'-pyrophosphohydrolase